LHNLCCAKVASIIEYKTENQICEIINNQNQEESINMIEKNNKINQSYQEFFDGLINPTLHKIFFEYQQIPFFPHWLKTNQQKINFFYLENDKKTILKWFYLFYFFFVYQNTKFDFENIFSEILKFFQTLIENIEIKKKSIKIFLMEYGKKKPYQFFMCNFNEKTFFNDFIEFNLEEYPYPKISVNKIRKFCSHYNFKNSGIDFFNNKKKDVNISNEKLEILNICFPYFFEFEKSFQK
jgi:hypothetical protein